MEKTVKWYFSCGQVKKDPTKDVHSANIVLWTRKKNEKHFR
jgi:hypothetical protein